MYSTAFIFIVIVAIIIGSICYDIVKLFYSVLLQVLCRDAVAAYKGGK